MRMMELADSEAGILSHCSELERRVLAVATMGRASFSAQYPQEPWARPLKAPEAAKLMGLSYVQWRKAMTSARRNVRKALEERMARRAA